MPRDTSEAQDLLAFLADSRSRSEELVEGYFTTESWAKRGGYAEELVKELSNMLETRAEVLRPLLRELDGGQQLLGRFDERRSRLLDLLAQLDDLTVGVGPRDVHQHRPERVVELVSQLRLQIHDYNEYEANQLVPFLEAQLDGDQLADLGQKADRASKRAPTHPHPDRPPADERTAMGKLASAAFDRIQDVGEHPKRAIEHEGEEGP
jgi:hypothetical protein